MSRATVVYGFVGFVALTAAIAAYLLTSSSGGSKQESHRPTEYRAMQGLGVQTAGGMAPAVVEAFARQVHSPAKSVARETTSLVPEEWEQPLFDVLIKEGQSIDERNTRLLELASGPARGAPAVQQECLMHLLFGIPDSNRAQFLAVATNPAIPVQMRVEFLNEVLAMRPTELGEWLSQQVSNHHEPAISSLARLYLLDLNNTAQ